MKKFKIKVPYDAVEDEHVKMYIEEQDIQDYSEYYDECWDDAEWDDAEWEEVK